jgi:hypothetical protein
MDLNEIVENIQKSNPKLLEGLPPRKVTVLLRAALGEISKNVTAAGDGKVRIAGLGVFGVRTVEGEKDGVKKSKRKIFFRPQAPKAAAAKPSK